MEKKLRAVIAIFLAFLVQTCRSGLKSDDDTIPLIISISVVIAGFLFGGVCLTRCCKRRWDAEEKADDGGDSLLSSPSACQLWGPPVTTGHWLKDLLLSLAETSTFFCSPCIKKCRATKNRGDQGAGAYGAVADVDISSAAPS